MTRKQVRRKIRNLQGLQKYCNLFYFLGGITREQHEKLKTQQKQYHDAKEKLEAQLLKLKEQREALKEDGAVHDDQIMKENAKLQVSDNFLVKPRWGKIPHF